MPKRNFSPGLKNLFRISFSELVHTYTGASEASSKWVGKTKYYSTCSKKWVGKRPFSIQIKQKSGWARAHPAHNSEVSSRNCLP